MSGLPYQTFLDGENMAALWQALKYFLFYVAPVIMIWFAIAMLGGLVSVIRGTAAGDDERRRGRDDDDYYY